MRFPIPFRRPLGERIRRLERKLADAEYDFEKWRWSYRPSRWDDERQWIAEMRTELAALKARAALSPAEEE